MRSLQTNETDVEAVEQELVSGCTYMPNDSAFGSVDLAAKWEVIYVPEQWHDVMATCKQHCNL